MARHLAPTEGLPLDEPKAVWWRRRILAVPTLAWLVILALSLVAVAAFYSRKDSAPDTFTAMAVGNVDIGSAEAVGIFAYLDADSLEPGDSIERCFFVGVDATGATQDGLFKVYSAGISGPLADTLEFSLASKPYPKIPTSPLGTAPCTTGHTSLYSGVLSGFGSAHTDYLSGVTINTPVAGVTSYYEVKATLTLPDTPAGQASTGQSASLAVAFENQ